MSSCRAAGDTRSVGLVIDTVVCLTLDKWETVSGQFGGYLSGLRGPLNATLVTIGLATSFTASSADAQQRPREGSRVVSRLEYATRARPS